MKPRQKYRGKNFDAAEKFHSDASFNEAAAKVPRKRAPLGFGCVSTWVSFNEAAAKVPRKTASAPRCTPDQAASMKPRQKYRGKPASGVVYSRTIWSFNEAAAKVPRKNALERSLAKPSEALQ